MMRKRPLKLLIFGLLVLAAVLAASVVTMLMLENTPGIQRETAAMHTMSDADWQNRYHQGLELFNQGKYPEADHIVQELLAERPGSGDAWQLRGSIAFRRNLFEDAERAFRHFLRLQPFHAGGHHNLSLALQRMDRKADALAAAERAAELAPGNSAILLHAAGLAVETGEEKKAVDLLKRAIRTGASPEAIARERELVGLLERPEILEALKPPEKTPETLKKDATFGSRVKKVNDGKN